MREKLVIPQFTEETRQALLNDGFSIHTLVGETMQELGEGRRIAFWGQYNPEFYTSRSRTTEVAINRNPNSFYLPENNQTLDQQLELVAQFSEAVGKKYPGAEALMGGVADYAELALKYDFGKLAENTRRTPITLFGKNYGWRKTRTVTSVDGSHNFSVGVFPADIYRVSVDHFTSKDEQDRFCWVAPLIVPR